MLKQLHARNFALLDDITLDFQGTLTVLTGETGAGKSILIDAIRFVAGEKIENIRGVSGAESFWVEAVFEIPDPLAEHAAVKEYLEADEGLLILKREVTQGRSRATINQRMVNQAVLRQIAELLIDIHGQYDHQMLFEPSTQLEILDRFAKTEFVKTKYDEQYTVYASLRNKIAEIERLKGSRERELDLLKYQIDEIERADIQDSDDEAIQMEKIKLTNIEKLAELTARILQYLDGEDSGASNLFQTAARDLHLLERLDPSLKELKSGIENIQLLLEEKISELRSYQDDLAFDEDRLEELDQKLNLIDLLKRKYGRTLDEVRSFYAEAKEKYSKLVDLDVEEGDSVKRLKQIETEIVKTAEILTEKRKGAASVLKKQINEELADLQLPNARFECAFASSELGPSGSDQIEFMVKINEGLPAAPLRKIVSAGEVSRIMLAMKKTLAKVDSVPTLIFDEIDANIGGRLGSITGKKLKEISEERQVLLVTHLPQIASFADQHIKVTKSAKKGKTEILYRHIDGDERIKELSEMMSGKTESEISKKHAQEMLAQVGKLK